MGMTETFETIPVEVKLESWDGNVKKMIRAFPAERARGKCERYLLVKVCGKSANI